MQQHELSATFPPVRPSARRAREFVIAGLHSAGVNEPVLDERMRLVASELVTNALLHAGTDIEVHMAVRGSDVWLEVQDDAPWQPTRIPSSLGATSGRGLILVDALADSWGVIQVRGGPGKSVWARVRRA